MTTTMKQGGEQEDETSVDVVLPAAAAVDAGILSSSFLPPVLPARGFISLHDDDNAATGGGIVFVGRELLTLPSECTSGYVDCYNGLVSGTTTSCADACLDGTAKCCDGIDACSQFTGKVCKDGNSCMGSKACYQAKIPWVVNSCYGGTYSCLRAGFNFGTVGNMINSCHGQLSCINLGRSGQVGYVRNSCLGEKACFYAGLYGGVGDIISSCGAKQACNSLGRVVQTLKTSNMNNCCNTERECGQYGTGIDSLPANCAASTASPSSAATTAIPTMAKASKNGIGKSTKKPTSSPTTSLSPTISRAPTKAKAGKKTAGKMFDLFH